jgi:transcriptional regulator with XRE-family HTH domain
MFYTLAQYYQGLKIMSELSSFIKDEMARKNWTFRVAEEQIGISKTALSNIINENQKPEMDTLVKISGAFNIPLWRVVEMAGYDLGFAKNKTVAERIASLIESVPEYEEGLNRLLRASPDQIEGMLAWLEGQDLVRERRAQAASKTS